MLTESGIGAGAGGEGVDVAVVVRNVVTGLLRIDCILLADLGCTAIGVIFTSSF
jgi:hypothetical protein